ncbi:MAG: UDP-N-acetylmuramate dehydrogenase [Gemmatimonadota bacterium]|nr:UDP-N-acetylmuramate dehydrogenase [Gemmatimonadota bacterium]MDH4350244.1 UDP-N-acetylmuramate dehydrogenase [Gemmatimonadota bacterium]
MSIAWTAELRRACRGRLLLEEPLAPYTTYRIGGPADAMLTPDGPGDIQRAVEIVGRHGVPWLVLGLGSNMLVADAGFRGLVIHVGKGLAEVTEGANSWTVGAGLPTPLLARRSARRGLGGVHRLVGVPGTVGGGVYMNAGAHGQEFRQVVQSVTLVNASGEVEQRRAGDIPWRYRASGLGEVVVIEAELRFTPGDPQSLEEEIADHLRWRKAGTPFSEACCGSVFRNPASPVTLPSEGSGAESRELRTAGQLIDAVGLKGLRIGGAEVSPMHANYIVNLGGASASDVMGIIDAVREQARREFGVALELEVQLVGNP